MDRDDHAWPLAEQLWSLCQVDRDRRAVCVAEQWWTWGQVTDVARAVDERCDGGAGQRVGVVLENRPEFVGAVIAVLGRERCLTTVSPLQPTPRLVADLRASGLRLLVASPSVWDRLDGEDLPLRGYRLHRDGSVDVVRDAPRGEDALPGVAVEMLTSGTTGPPKRVGLGYRQLTRSLRSGGQPSVEPRLSDDVSITATPLVHIGGLWSLLMALDNGRATVLLERFEVQPWAAAVERYRPKGTGVVPAGIHMLLESDVAKERLASLLMIKSGTAALDPALAEGFTARFGIPVLPVYGATEFCGAVAGWSLADHQEYRTTKRGSVGRAEPGVELRVVDETGTPVAEDVPGRLEVRTEQAPGRPDEWTATTDLARLDADGFLYILGRADATIVRGGFKIDPAAVVHVLESHPSVREAAVVALPDERRGQVPVAAVEVRAGVSVPAPDELMRLCRDRLLPYEVPAQVRVVDRLPRTPSLKVSNVDLVKMFGAAAE
ncbi:class I adenylate-forming enzyme family protein [Pseudonocardia spinosispora]|uniref:class I adenylate-forming enzyme family protein n=1 Tax=Pseudonocardia spinosispora TaxID=103441 RepID=UPI00041DD101|nr:fatty acid--CoA ligase family protein [Pseudonocardia spinosispora]